MLKRALFAGAALVIGATFMQGAVTPASAGPNVKPKVTAPKPRIPVVKVKPRIRLRVDPRRFKKKETVPSTQQTAVPPNIPRVDEAGGAPAGNDNAGQTPDFAANIERLAELAEIGAFKENIEGMLGILNISGLGGGTGVPGIREWGAGQDGNGNKIPGAGGENAGAPSDPDFGDTGDRRNPGAGPNYGDLGMDLLGRTSGALGSGEKMGGGVAAAPSPGDALGGIASQDEDARSFSPWTHRRGMATRHTGWYESPERGAGTRSHETETVVFSTNQMFRRRETVDENGTHVEVETTVYRMNRSRYRGAGLEPPPGDPHNANAPDEKGSGDAGKPDSGDTGKPKDIAKQQDPYSGGVVVWIPPSCGSAQCNAARDLLKNPKGNLLQVTGKSTRVHGDREGGATGTTHRLVIDQHGLVVSYGADSGPAHSGGGRVQRLGKTRIQK